MILYLKSLFAICLLLASLFIYGCKAYSWMVLENPEFPDATRPSDIPKEVKEKYSVANVIVHPRIVYTDGSQTTQEVFVAFFSKTNTTTVSIISLDLAVDAERLEYGQRITAQEPSPWEMYPANTPFYVCSASGGPIAQTKGVMIKSHVDVSLVVVAIDEAGQMTRKKIVSRFVSRKRAYLE